MVLKFLLSLAPDETVSLVVKVFATCLTNTIEARKLFKNDGSNLILVDRLINGCYFRA